MCPQTCLLAPSLCDFPSSRRYRYSCHQCSPAIVDAEQGRAAVSSLLQGMKKWVFCNRCSALSATNNLRTRWRQKTEGDVCIVFTSWGSRLRHARELTMEHAKKLQAQTAVCGTHTAWAGHAFAWRHCFRAVHARERGQLGPQQGRPGQHLSDCLVVGGAS